MSKKSRATFAWIWGKKQPNYIDEIEQRSIAKQTALFLLISQHNKEIYPSKEIVYEEFSCPQKKR